MLIANGRPVISVYYICYMRKYDNLFKFIDSICETSIICNVKKNNKQNDKYGLSRRNNDYSLSERGYPEFTTKL
ncbi:hypothetical protein CUN85_05875 [Methanolobus halotolerans]|uniref:Uncharacterized protein n=1 Tax=Methanolobus halotolerans TaxID=2052935 RepID=A0A4E0PZH3_9EURY|nr:hypothetical protein CUN85_05875 [Methanolobus halotolerans]